MLLAEKKTFHYANEDLKVDLASSNKYLREYSSISHYSDMIWLWIDAIKEKTL